MIYYFGDSHTSGIGSVGSPNPDMWYHIPYSKYLTDLLKMESKNLALPGQNFVLNVIELVNNIKNIEDNAKIVLFQTQYFCNTLLRYNNTNFNIKDIVMTSHLLNDNEVYENKTLGIDKDNSRTLIDWGYTFEERRSFYELEIVISIFNYLKLKGIACYLLYWIEPFTIELPINEFVLKFKNGYFASNGTDMKPKTLYNETNGEWDDYHTSNDWNNHLANEIYKIISK